MAYCKYKIIPLISKNQQEPLLRSALPILVLPLLYHEVEEVLKHWFSCTSIISRVSSVLCPCLSFLIIFLHVQCTW